jgi:hypothetical protein
MRRRRLMIVGLAVAVLLGGGLIAQAAIPDAQGMIHGCYKLNNPAKGSVLVVDSETGGTCPSGFAVLNWRQGVPLALFDPNVAGSVLQVPADGELHAFHVECGPGSAITGVQGRFVSGEEAYDPEQMRPYALPVVLDGDLPTGPGATVYARANPVGGDVGNIVVEFNCYQVGPS